MYFYTFQKVLGFCVQNLNNLHKWLWIKSYGCCDHLEGFWKNLRSKFNHVWARFCVSFIRYHPVQHFCIFQVHYSITWHKAWENKLHHILLLPQVLSQCLRFFLINRTSCVLVRETWQIISCHSQFLQIFTGNIVHWNYFWWHCKLDNEIQSILGPAYQNQAVWMTQDIESFILILHISNLCSGASNHS